MPPVEIRYRPGTVTFLEQALQIIEKNDKDNYQAKFEALENLGNTYRELGDLDIAPEYVNKALQLKGFISNPP